MCTSATITAVSSGVPWTRWRCRGGGNRHGHVIAPRCIFVFCISVICAAYCCVLHANGGLVREESPVSWFLKLDGLTEEDKCDTV